DVETGRELYKARFPGSATFSASPWAHEGTVFCLSEDGETFAVEAGDAFKVVGRSAMGEMSLATPALAHDSLFLRPATKLYRLRAPGALRPPRRAHAPHHLFEARIVPQVVERRVGLDEDHHRGPRAERRLERAERLLRAAEPRLLGRGRVGVLVV